MDIMGILTKLFSGNGLVVAFLTIGIIMYLSLLLSKNMTKGRVHHSAIAIVIALFLAYLGGRYGGGKKGLADITLFSGLGLMGGAMFRDFAIVSTAFGADFKEIKKAGAVGVFSLFFGVIMAFAVGAIATYALGYRDPAVVTTIASGATTFIVGPVTGAALGVSSDIIALSIAIGVVKSILVMVFTPMIAKYIGLTTPKKAMIYGGLMGTTSGVSAGLAATDVKLVPYGALTATFYTGLGCLLAPSILYFIMRALLS